MTSTNAMQSDFQSHNNNFENDSDSELSSDTSGHLDELELTRINTYRLQQKTTVGSVRGLTPREQWLAMGAGKEHPPLLPDSEAYVVEFDGADDPIHPYNWSTIKRYVSKQGYHILSIELPDMNLIDEQVYPRCHPLL